jgi:hypothetical protein
MKTDMITLKSKDRARAAKRGKDGNKPKKKTKKKQRRKDARVRLATSEKTRDGRISQEIANSRR